MITALVGEAHVATIQILEKQAKHYSASGNKSEGIRLGTKSVEPWRKVHGDLSASTLDAMDNLASSYSNQGQHQEAGKMWRKVLDGRRKLLGAQHSSTLHPLYWLAYATQSQERYADAEVLFRELMTSQESTLGKKAYGTLNRTVQDCRTNFGMETPDTVDSLYWCALCKFQLKRYSEAEALLTESLAGYRKLSGDRQYDILVRSDNLQPGAVHRIGGIVEGSDICVSKRRWRSTHRYHKPAVLEWSLIFRSTSVRRGRSTVQAGL